jgi:hypothetical protein
MAESFKDRRDREEIHKILTESIQIKGSIPEARKAFDESWIDLIKNYKSAQGPMFNVNVVREYLEEKGCSSHTIEEFIRTYFSI